MNQSEHKGIWVFAEQENGVINSSVYELLGKAAELQAHNGEEICAVLLGCGIAGLAKELIARGADKVIAVEDESLASYSARPYQKALTELAQKYRPNILLYAATSPGRDLAPRVMVSLKTGLTADAIDLAYDEDGMFYQTTPAYGGSIMARIVIPEKRPQMATVRTKLFSPLPPDYTRAGKIINETVHVEKDDCFKLISAAEKAVSGVPIEKAEIIVSGGRGVKDEEELKLLEELALILGGQLASSRPLVDSGLLPHSRQIGQSGATVKPKLIINAAISGSIQYQIGMQDAGCIVSINKSDSAPIFDISNFGAVADFKALVPALTAEIKKRRQ